jgi:hypothetical protein
MKIFRIQSRISMRKKTDGSVSPQRMNRGKKMGSPGP